ncbi:Putative SOS response-associated peptidase YedK [Jannaschia faecimaris]|uniref:Abasic site processing protein n=1 Tax=Jannaschia faecimaris TaxID=1244108 RepID=A0A1H3NSL4_9RHOB|nr:SOS response-associated peptidase [Jannaschia faecimaris]SDY91824.1 Putative SOS response-associated peptidase YedK [Jannaschia faecimaris]
MCGRYALTLPHEAMTQLFGATPSNDLPEGPRWNICPTTQIPVVTAGGDMRRLVSMRWGFLPHWYETPTSGPLLINARAETIAEKPAFRDACRHRRCLIPATGFYEWTKTADGARLPWYFHDPSDAPLVFAGIWQDWGPEAISTCAIVSCAAGPTMAEVHHREPATLAPNDWALWLGEEGKGAAPLMQAAPEDRIVRHRVSRVVNSNRTEGPELIEPLIDEEDV